MPLESSQGKLYCHHFTRLQEVRLSVQRSTGIKWQRLQALPSPLGPLLCAGGHSADWLVVPHQNGRAGRIRKGWGCLCCQFDDQGPGIPPMLVIIGHPSQICPFNLSRIFLLPRYFKSWAPSQYIVGLCGSEFAAHLKFFISFFFCTEANPRNMSIDRDSPEKMEISLLWSWWRPVFIFIFSSFFKA